MEKTSANEIAHGEEHFFSGLNERRKESIRANFSAPLVFSHFNSSQLFTVNKSRFYNQSEFGACFYAMQSYPSGTILFIRLNVEQLDGDIREEALTALPYRNTTLAEVRWCEPVETLDMGNVYKIGIKYL